MSTIDSAGNHHVSEDARIAYLEGMCVGIQRMTQGEGVLMLILHPGKRAEVVAALPAEAEGLAAIVRRLADELESGGGVPMGNHARTFPGKAVRP